MNAKNALGLLVAVCALAQVACGAVLVPPATPDTRATVDAILTMAAQTGTPSFPSAIPATSTSTTATLGLPAPTSTSFPAFPTSTPFVLPSPTATRFVACDAAAFIKDVTIMDGATLSQGTQFTKIWRLQNTGTCTWNNSYALVFSKGSQMDGPNVKALSGTVYPGETVDIAVDLIAPDKNGHYVGYWKLRSPSNVLFGIGPQGDSAFWVDINVYAAITRAYDFVASYCKADWENNNASLPCPGTQGDDQGYVLRVKAPRNENGVKANLPGLITQPRMTNNGIIRGTYPAFAVKAGDHFRARVSCRYLAERCDVIFQLDFRTGGRTVTLGSWHEVYEGRFTDIDIDLSSLADKTGRFVLTVQANGSSKNDEALWIGPRIMR